MVKLEWGTKRVCLACTSRFYDLRRSPIICPKCGETLEVQTGNRRSRNRTAFDDEKDLLPLEEAGLIDALDLPEDIDADVVEDEGLMEDTSDLAEDLDDMSEMIDHGEEPEER